MNIKKSAIIGVCSFLIFIVGYGIYSNYILETSPDGIGDWTGTADGVEKQIEGPSFLVDSPFFNP